MGGIEGRSLIGGMTSISCSTEVHFACSGRVEVCGSALRESCSTAAGSITCSTDCPAAGCFDCSGWVGIKLVGVWPDEEILLKIFVRSPQRPCSSLESSSSIIGARGRVEMVGCIRRESSIGMEG